MDIRTKHQMRFNTHAATVTIDTDNHVHVFKYSNNTCDFDTFNDYESAADYVLAPPEDCGYRVVVHGDS
jgi:hypothetical protein